MAKQFTAEDFETVAEWEPESHDVTRAALKIAAAVMRPGSIEAALQTHFLATYRDPDYADPKHTEEAAVIRKALTDAP